MGNKDVAWALSCLALSFLSVPLYFEGCIQVYEIISTLTDKEAYRPVFTKQRQSNSISSACKPQKAGQNL